MPLCVVFFVFCCYLCASAMCVGFLFCLLLFSLVFLYFVCLLNLCFVVVLFGVMFVAFVFLPRVCVLLLLLCFLCCVCFRVFAFVLCFVEFYLDLLIVCFCFSSVCFLLFLFNVYVGGWILLCFVCLLCVL